MLIWLTLKDARDDGNVLININNIKRVEYKNNETVISFIEDDEISVVESFQEILELQSNAIKGQAQE
ncbi:hypothetical protein [Ochrobactrum sp. MYb379]|uniref:hypothetical protein n=1 Tax=Ochrobactrum sp. MYb379 TaxID=2745275 RepID=UPI0030A18EC3